jgi:hypothetical protein
MASKTFDVRRTAISALTGNRVSGYTLAVNTRTTTPRRGRPAKGPEEKYLQRSFKCPPDLWAEVEAWVPSGERSALIQEALRREVRKRRKWGSPAQRDALAVEGYRRMAESETES